MRCAFAGFLLVMLAVAFSGSKPVDAEGPNRIEFGKQIFAGFAEAQVAEEVHGCGTFEQVAPSVAVRPKSPSDQAFKRESLLAATNGSYYPVRWKLFHYGLYKPPYFKRYTYEGDYFLYPAQAPPRGPNGLVLTGNCAELTGLGGDF